MTQMANEGTVPAFDKADRLAKALQHAGVSVQEMADELGISRNTVGNYINRRTEIPRGYVIAWALRCGVPFSWLDEARTDGGERARRDSNPKPSDREFDPAFVQVTTLRRRTTSYDVADEEAA